MTVAFRVTTDDLDKLPEIEGVRYEIIDGELYVTHAPGEPHQYVCGVLNYELHGWSMESGRGLAIPGPGLVFAIDNDVIPDLVWISYERRATALDAKGHYKFAPELIVEVLSPGSVNERRDRDLKLNLYARQGAEEYWIADPRQHTLEVYRRNGTTLELAFTLGDGDVLTSPLLPGFSCSIASLWSPAVRS